MHSISKILMQGPFRKGLNRISARSPHNDLTRSCENPSTKDFARTTGSSHRGLCKIMQGPPSKDFTRISARSFHKDLYKITQGLLSEDFTRISARSSHTDLYSTRSCKDLLERTSQGSAQDFVLYKDLCTRRTS